MRPKILLSSLFSFSKLFFLSMENALNQTDIVLAFQCKETKTHRNPSMGNALHESSSSPSFRRNRGTRRKRREYLQGQKEDNYDHGLNEKEKAEVLEQEDEEDDDQKVEVKRKIVALQRIVPGGESFGADKLFEETAEYILALQCQIKALRFLTSFIEGLEKQKRKVGG